MHVHAFDGQGLCPCGADLYAGRPPVTEVDPRAAADLALGRNVRALVEKAEDGVRLGKRSQGNYVAMDIAAIEVRIGATLDEAVAAAKEAARG
jgi:hypothetical protein